MITLKTLAKIQKQLNFKEMEITIKYEKNIVQSITLNRKK